MCTMSSTALLLWVVSAAVTVYCSKTASIEIYGLKGHFIRLGFPAQPTVSESKVKWTLEDGTKLVNENNAVSPNYIHKVDFGLLDHSVQLKNLSVNDSGVYHVYSLSQWKDTLVASYKLMVLEAVSKPIMKIFPAPPHSNSSGQNCSFHVNCSSSSSWASYNCDENQCSVFPTSRTTYVSFTFGIANGQIVCNVSNPVSTETASEKLPESCNEDRSGELPSSHLQRDIFLASAACAALLLLICAILLARRCHTSKAEETSQKHCDIPTVVVTSDSDEPRREEVTSIYSVVNKSAQICTRTNKTSKPVSADGEHQSLRQQEKRGKLRPLEDMTIYTTASKPKEEQLPVEDTDRSIYTTATNPLEEERPLEDAIRTIYDTARTQQHGQVPPVVANTEQAETDQPDTVYYTLGHTRTGHEL